MKFVFGERSEGFCAAVKGMETQATVNIQNEVREDRSEFHLQHVFKRQRLNSSPKRIRQRRKKSELS